jgi:hypothetical protein
MVNLVQLLEDLAGVLQSCPEVVAQLDGAQAIVPYLDLTTSTQNSVTRALYMMPNGAVMLAWQSTGLTQTDMTAWAHQIDVYVRALRLRSPLPLINGIIDGVPEGTDLRWRYSCINEWVLPVEIEEIARLTDEEGMDYFVIRTIFREKGDDSYGVSS